MLTVTPVSAGSFSLSMASPSLCSPEIYQLNQLDSGQDFFTGPSVYSRHLFCAHELDIWLWNQRHTFIIKEAGLLFRNCKVADKCKAKNTQEKEGKKDGELTVSRNEQRIMEYCTGAIYSAAGLQPRYLFNFFLLQPFLRDLLHDLTIGSA